MQPGAALACLFALGTAAGVWVWTMSQKNTPAKPVQPSEKPVVTGPAGKSAEPETILAAQAIQNGLPEKEGRLKALEQENANLRKELAGLLGAEVSPSPVPPGSDGAASLPAPPAAVATLEDVAAIQKKVTAVENRILEFEGENMRLRKQVADEIEAKKPPPTIEEVAARVVATRELAFRRTPEWTSSTAEEIIKRLAGKAVSGIKPEAADARVRAYLAMGFVRETFDYRSAIASVGVMKPGGYYDADTGKFYYQGDASLARADSRGVFAAALLPVLIEQNFPAAAAPQAESENDDEARAMQAMALGDASFSRVKFSVGDQLVFNSDRGQAPAGMQQSPNAPQFIADLWKWSEDSGSAFVQALHQKRGLAAVNKAWARPPRSTAEILHPDKLYLEGTPFEPVKVAFPEATVNDAAPYFSNVAGEVAAYFVVRTFADVDYATAATEGWKGDRYAVWTGSKEHGDHLLWRTVWAGDADAKEFFDAMRRGLMQRFDIPWQKEYDAVPNQFRVDDPHRVIRLVQKGAEVTLVNATEPEFARAMEERFLK